MNKKVTLLFLVALFMITFIIGCKGEKSSNTGMIKDSIDSSSVVTDSVLVEKDVPLVVDSIGKSFNSSNIQVDLAYSFPVSGPQPLVDSLRVFLRTELEGTVGVYSSTTSKIKSYKNLSNGRGMINYYAKLAYKNLCGINDDADSAECILASELSTCVMKKCETKSYVTYRSFSYIYSGGAHGMAGDVGFTFDKKTGEKVQKILSPKHIKALQPMLKTGFRSYFREMAKSNGSRNIESEVKDNMDNLLLEHKIISLPENGVSLSPEGVVFIYGEYEAGCYAIGMPTFTVPYSKIGKYLSPKARRLVGLN